MTPSIGTALGICSHSLCKGSGGRIPLQNQVDCECRWSCCRHNPLPHLTPHPRWRRQGGRGWGSRHRSHGALQCFHNTAFPHSGQAHLNGLPCVMLVGLESDQGPFGTDTLVLRVQVCLWLERDKYRSPGSGPKGDGPPELLKGPCPRSHSFPFHWGLVGLQDVLRVHVAGRLCP